MRIHWAPPLTERRAAAAPGRRDAAGGAHSTSLAETRRAATRTLAVGADAPPGTALLRDDDDVRGVERVEPAEKLRRRPSASSALPGETSAVAVATSPKPATVMVTIAGTAASTAAGASEKSAGASVYPNVSAPAAGTASAAPAADALMDALAESSRSSAATASAASSPSASDA